jgi:hypothetical protein
MTKSIRRVADIPIDQTGTFMVKGIRGVAIVAGN